MIKHNASPVYESFYICIQEEKNLLHRRVQECGFFVMKTRIRLILQYIH